MVGKATLERLSCFLNKTVSNRNFGVQETEEENDSSEQLRSSFEVMKIDAVFHNLDAHSLKKGLTKPVGIDNITEMGVYNRVLYEKKQF